MSVLAVRPAAKVGHCRQRGTGHIGLLAVQLFEMPSCRERLHSQKTLLMQRCILHSQADSRLRRRQLGDLRSRT